MHRGVKFTGNPKVKRNMAKNQYIAEIKQDIYRLSINMIYVSKIKIKINQKQRS